MTTELLLLSYAAATGRQLAMLAGLASSAVFGVVLGTTAWVGWAPNTLVAAGSAVVFTSAGAAGLAICQHEAGRQVDNAPDDGHGKLGFAKGGRTGART
jgi:nitrous oxide reductase